MKKILLVASALLLATPAMAQHAHEKGPNGGQMEDVAGVEVEMVASGKTLTFNVFDEAKKPVSTNGFSGSVMLTSGSDRETIPLVAAGNALKAEAKAAKRGVAANLAVCDAKVARWARKSEKACCSDYAYDPGAHEECVAAVDIAVIDAGTGSCEGGDSEAGIPDVFAQRWKLGDICNERSDNTFDRDEYDCCVSTPGCEPEASWNAETLCNEMTCKCEESMFDTADRGFQACVASVGGEAEPVRQLIVATAEAMGALRARYLKRAKAWAKQQQQH